MAEGTARQTADGRPCEFVSACISARGGEGVKVNPIQAINVCQTCSHVPLGGFRKSKSCQKHLQLFTGLQNYALMTVRTEKTMKN